MTNFPVFKRMRFFTGFFTTAKDWTEGQDYFRDKQKLHNRGLHTPGIIAGLRVVEAGDLKVRVQPGAALDGLGNEISLPTPTTVDVKVPADLSEPKSVFIAIKYGEVETDYVENVEAPQYNGHTRVAEVPVLMASQEIPDNETWMELARIRLVAGVTEISNAEDPDAPGDNEINLHDVMRAGSVGLAGLGLPPDVLAQVVVVMEETRRDFAELARAFPAPSVVDVRTTASTAKILAQAGVPNSEQVVSILDGIADVELEVVGDVERVYPDMVDVPQFRNYREAAEDLVNACQESQSLNSLLAKQLVVSEEAEKLAQIIGTMPVADTGVEGGATTVVTTGDEATVTLDASDSDAFGEREIVKYIWDKRS